MPKNRFPRSGSAGAASKALVEFLAYYETRYGTLTRAQLENAWAELRAKRKHSTPGTFWAVLEALRKTQHSQKLRMVALAHFLRERADQYGEISAEEISAAERDLFPSAPTARSHLSTERTHRTSQGSPLVIDAVRRPQYSKSPSVMTPKSPPAKPSNEGRKPARGPACLSRARKDPRSRV